MPSDALVQVFIQGVVPLHELRSITWGFVFVISVDFFALVLVEPTLWEDLFVEVSFVFHPLTRFFCCHQA